MYWPKTFPGERIVYHVPWTVTPDFFTLVVTGPEDGAGAPLAMPDGVSCVYYDWVQRANIWRVRCPTGYKALSDIGTRYIWADGVTLTIDQPANAADNDGLCWKYALYDPAYANADPPGHYYNLTTSSGDQGSIDAIAPNFRCVADDLAVPTELGGRFFRKCGSQYASQTEFYLKRDGFRATINCETANRPDHLQYRLDLSPRVLYKDLQNIVTLRNPSSQSHDLSFTMQKGIESQFSTTDESAYEFRMDYSTKVSAGVEYGIGEASV